MTRKEIVNFWGYDNLIRWPEECLREVAISQTSRQFLIEVGFPRNVDWAFRFDCGCDLPRLECKTNCRRIGFDGTVPICIDEQRSGSVVAAETVVGGVDRLINSTVQCFGAFLVLYQEYRQAARAKSEESTVKIISDIEARMGKIDPEAFDDSNNYWPLIIEQMYQGLL